jgi:hypothetical protein
MSTTKGSHQCVSGCHQCGHKETLLELQRALPFLQPFACPKSKTSLFLRNTYVYGCCTCCLALNPQNHHGEFQRYPADGTEVQIWCPRVLLWMQEQLGKRDTLTRVSKLSTHHATVRPACLLCPTPHSHARSGRVRQMRSPPPKKTRAGARQHQN